MNRFIHTDLFEPEHSDPLGKLRNYGAFTYRVIGSEWRNDARGRYWRVTLELLEESDER